MKLGKSSGNCQLHNVNFYNIEPRSIAYMCYNKKSSKIGVLRDDANASIEIWNIHNTPFLERTIFLSLDNVATAVEWAGHRLFSTMSSGQIIEWNLKTLKPERYLLITGNAALSLDVNNTNTKIAVGSDDGYVNIFNIENNDMAFERIFDKQEGRILCCKFDFTGNFIITGSMGAVRVWNVQNGHAVHRMSTGRSETNKETCVWCCHVLKDFTIITGDSRGRITFWDGNIGAQLDSIQALKGDVLAIAVDDNEESLFCSGVDPFIKKYSQIEVKKEDIIMKKWVKDINRKIHDHDIHALILNGKQLFSAGTDGYISKSSQPPKTLEKYGPFLSSSAEVTSDAARLILLKYVNYLEIWQLGKAEKKLVNCEELQMVRGPTKLLELKSKHGESILCSSISSNGSLIMYSTNEVIRLFQFISSTVGPPTLEILEVLPIQFAPSINCHFSKDSQRIFLNKRDGSIDVFSIENNSNIEYLETIATDEYIKDKINIIASSSCGTYLICSGLCNAIAVWSWNKKTSSYEYYTTLPKYNCPAVSLVTHMDQPIIAFVYADLKIFQYNLKQLKFTSTLRMDMEGVPSIKNILLDARNNNVLVLNTETAIQVINREEKDEKTPSKQKKKLEEHEDKFSLKVIKKYNHLVHLSWLCEGELVAVDVNPVSLIEQLPPTLKVKKFGVS